VLKFALSNPPDRVTYGNLSVIRAEFDEMMRLALEAGILSRPVAYDKYVDESFVRNFRPVPITIGK
jgi:NitT/TauT family transport system substrate-binding protein